MEFRPVQNRLGSGHLAEAGGAGGVQGGLAGGELLPLGQVPSRAGRRAGLPGLHLPPAAGQPVQHPHVGGGGGQ